MSFYWFMSSGGDGDEEEDEFMLAQGPFKVSTELMSSDGVLECFVGDEINLIAIFSDATGDAVNCTGTTVTALVTDSEGNTEVTPTVTAKWAEGGIYLISFDVPATRGDYRLTLRRSATDDTTTAGPLIVRVDVR